MNEDEVTIRQLVQDWMSASRSGDINTVLELMSDDVLFLVPGREPFGKAQFETDFKSMKEVGMNGRAEIIELQICGDWAWLRNSINLAISIPGHDPVQRKGQTLTVLRKETDGRWRLARDANFVS
jgi:uncharacterized protein (TIGR02246 family)